MKISKLEKNENFKIGKKMKIEKLKKKWKFKNKKMKI